MSWYERLLLIDPARVVANLERMRAAGAVDASPNTWQLSLGVLRMLHRVAFRSETVGTSQQQPHARWRARLLENRALRLPFLLASRAVIPFDLTGLRSRPERLIDHLLGAHHDGNQFVFDLELLAGHGALAELQRRVDAVLDGSDPRAAWLRDLTVYVGYHEGLAAAVRAGPHMTAAEAADPDKTLRGLIAWCARQPATPEATLAAWQSGRFRIAAPIATPPTRDDLLAATGSQLAAYLAAGHPLAPEQLAGHEYHGTSLGLPAWIERATWKTFVKAFVADGDGVRGWNVRVDQRAPFSPKLKGGKPITFGHFAVVRDGEHVMLEYDGVLRDPLVALDAGSADRLLGCSLVDIAGVRLPTPSYFLLERGRPVSELPRFPRRRSRRRSAVPSAARDTRSPHARARSARRPIPTGRRASPSGRGPR